MNLRPKSCLMGRGQTKGATRTLIVNKVLNSNEQLYCLVYVVKGGRGSGNRIQNIIHHQCGEFNMSLPSLQVAIPLP